MRQNPGMKILPCLLCAAAVSLTAAAARGADACSVKDRSERLALVICPAGSSQAQLRQAGEAACAGKQVCNAWIWENAAQVPAKAPAMDTELPKTATGAARAVWMQDAGQLMELRRTKK